PGQQGQEAPDVIRAPLGEAKEIHPRREDGTRSRQNEGTDVLGDPVQLAQEGVEQLDIECARVPMRQAKGEDTCGLRACDRLPHLCNIQRVACSRIKASPPGKRRSVLCRCAGRRGGWHKPAETSLLFSRRTERSVPATLRGLFPCTPGESAGH